MQHHREHQVAQRSQQRRAHIIRHFRRRALVRVFVFHRAQRGDISTRLVAVLVVLGHSYRGQHGVDIGQCVRVHQGIIGARLRLVAARKHKIPELEEQRVLGSKFSAQQQATPPQAINLRRYVTHLQVVAEF